MMSILDAEWLEVGSERKWLVGVSGGRDSVVLLHACAAIEGSSDGFVVCHVNHGLRGEASDGDEQLVRDLAEEYGFEVSVHRVDVGEVAKVEKKSLELAAREARHVAFASACEEYGCDGVLLAHHADDQAETVLYNLLRGSAGLKGMQGEVFLEGMGLTLVRPMLGVRRSEINDYVAEHGLEFREDATNAEPFAVRNRLRNEGIPLLSEILGRDVSTAIVKSLQHSEESEGFIEEMIDYPSMLDPQGRLYLPSLVEVPEVIQRRILHRYLRECGVSNISQELIESCLDLLDSENVAKVNLPRGRFLRRKEQRVFVGD